MALPPTLLLIRQRALAPPAEAPPPQAGPTQLLQQWWQAGAAHLSIMFNPVVWSHPVPLRLRLQQALAATSATRPTTSQELTRLEQASSEVCSIPSKRVSQSTGRSPTWVWAT